MYFTNEVLHNCSAARPVAGSEGKIGDLQSQLSSLQTNLLDFEIQRKNLESQLGAAKQEVGWREVQ